MKNLLLIVAIIFAAATVVYFIFTSDPAVSAAIENRPQADTIFFDGISLSGWSSANMEHWSVDNGAIIGQSNEDIKRNEFLWSQVEVSDFYLNIDVMLDPNERNAGIQFRSRRLDETEQAVGYQADVGVNVWGRLYHEHDRGPLDWTDRGEKAVKPGGWNRYEILAIDDRIWTAINGTLSVAINDPSGEKSGYIALQIHSGKPQVVKYRVNALVHNPKIELAGLNESELEKYLKAPLLPEEGQAVLNPK